MTWRPFSTSSPKRTRVLPSTPRFRLPQTQQWEAVGTTYHLRLFRHQTRPSLHQRNGQRTNSNLDNLRTSFPVCTRMTPAYSTAKPRHLMTTNRACLSMSTSSSSQRSLRWLPRSRVRRSGSEARQPPMKPLCHPNVVARAQHGRAWHTPRTLHKPIQTIQKISAAPNS